MKDKMSKDQWDNEAKMAEEMMSQKVWAVIGANNNPRKYGNMIYNKLKSNDYQVYPVNHRYESIDGEKCYPSISDLPELPDVLNMVVAPRICEDYLHEAASLGIKYVWLQPGTHDQSVMDLIDKYELQAIQACVLVALR